MEYANVGKSILCSALCIFNEAKALRELFVFMICGLGFTGKDKKKR
jgi:hypothetical protein